MSHRSRSISARSFELCAAGRTLVDIGISDIRPTPVRLMTSARPIRSGGCFYINCIRRIAVIRRHGYPAPPRGIRGGGTAAGHRIRDPFYADLPPAAPPKAYRYDRRWQPLDQANTGCPPPASTKKNDRPQSLSFNHRTHAPIQCTLRRVGDSNPRYSYPYGSLANYWFQPLTQLSGPLI